MGNFFQEDYNAIKGGFWGGIVISGILCFGNIFNNIPSDSLIKILLTGLGGIAGGFGTAIGRWAFNKIFKNKIHGKEESSEEESSQKKSNVA